MNVDQQAVDLMEARDLTLDEAPHGYDVFQRKAEGCVKVVLRP